MLQHRPADPATTRRFGRVHRLQLSVLRIELFERPDSEELTFEAKAKERNRRIEEAINVEHMDVLGRAVQIGEAEVVLQKLAHILGSRVVN
jgi:hypothetical protein